MLRNWALELRKIKARGAGAVHREGERSTGDTPKTGLEGFAGPAGPAGAAERSTGRPGWGPSEAKFFNFEVLFRGGLWQESSCIALLAGAGGSAAAGPVRVGATPTVALMASIGFDVHVPNAHVGESLVVHVEQVRIALELRVPDLLLACELAHH